MAKIDDMTLKVDVMGLDDLADLLETIRQRLDDQDARLDGQDVRLKVIGRLAISCSNRITALEQQLDILAQGENDDE